MTRLLAADGLFLFRGDHCILKNLEFALAPGEALLVQGPNGSGKTTLLRALAGLLHPDEGRIEWCDEDIRARGQAYRAELAWFAHRTGFKGDLSIVDNLHVDAGLNRMAMERLDDVLERTGIASRRDLPFRVLSAGQQRRAGLARLLLSRATLWLMDEPLTNLDAAGQSLVVALIREHLGAGGGCVFASHQDVEDFPGLKRIRLS